MDLGSLLDEAGRLPDVGVSDTCRPQESDSKPHCLQESDRGCNTNYLQETDSNTGRLQESDSNTCRLQESDSNTCRLQESDSDSNTNCLQETDSDAHKLQKINADEDSTTGIHFFPPLYTQRYTLALNYLRKHNIKSIIDFGCSECGLMKLLPTVASLEQIALVDIDRDLLVKRKSAINPELQHYVFRRCNPLHVSLWAGSAEDTDFRLLGFEAVTLIEVIEHLYPNVLENVTHNVFGNLSPKLCVVTTPNAEFNILFENDDPNQFRHWDHKFEWTRQEFRQWCDETCQVYGYQVEYSGVGHCSSRPNSEHLGPCSQAAIFTLQEENKTSACTHMNFHTSLPYELLAEADFPYEEDVLSVEEKVDLEVSYYLRQVFARRREDLVPGESVMISVSSLAELSTLKDLCDESGLRSSLQRCNYRLSSDGLCVILDDSDEPEDDLLDAEEEDDDDDRDQIESDYDLKLWRSAATDSGDESCGRLQDEDGIILCEENWDTEAG